MQLASTPPDCISIVHSAMSRVIRKLRLPDYAEQRDLRSLPGGLIDTDTSGNLKCVRVKVQPPLPSSPTFPGARGTLSLVKHEWIPHSNCHSSCVFTSWRKRQSRFQNFQACPVSRMRLLCGTVAATAAYTYDFCIELHSTVEPPLIEPPLSEYSIIWTLYHSRTSYYTNRIFPYYFAHCLLSR